MPNLSLIELWSGITEGSYVESGNTFTFDPKPNSVDKSVQVKWRIRRPGYSKKLERARFRFNEKIEFKIAGSCPGAKRDEMEWYTKRDSIFRVEVLDMNTYHAEMAGDSEEAAQRYWANVTSNDLEEVYVVIENTKFSQAEAKQDWFSYTMTLRRIHKTRR